MKIHHLIGLSLGLVITAFVAYAFSTGGGATTGAPGEATCGASLCHNTYADNLPGGALAITCSDSTWSPGDLLTFHVSLFRPGRNTWSFQSEFFLTNNLADKGTLINSTPYTRIVTSGQPLDRQLYIENNTLGLYSGTPDSSPGWDFQWRAPNITPGGKLDFYVGGLAANGDHQASYDYVYTGHLAIAYKPAASCCVGTVGNVDCDPDDNVDIADLTLMVDHLFVNFTELCCTKEGYLDNNAWVDISDLTIMVDHLFITFQPLQTCIY